MLTLPNFERLKIFHVVYSNRSIQRAANLLNVTRSAVSQSLKLLEEELGTKLFIRDSKNFQASSEAEELFKTIDPFVSELQGALQRLEAGIQSPIGHIRIGAPMDFGSGHLTKLIGKFRKDFPEITFEILLAVPVKQLGLLCEGKLDLAFIDNGDIHASGFPVTVQNLIKEEFILVASPTTFKKFNLTAATVENIARVPVVDYLPHAPVTKMWFKHHFSKEPSDLKVAYSAESVRAVLNAVATDIGIGVVPNLLVSGDFKHLKKIETARGRFINQIVIARQIGKRVTAREKAFIQFCKAELKP